MERLQKVIANSGYCSRRKAEELISSGKVLVNDELVNELGFKVSDKDIIVVDGVLLEKDNKVYYLLNKPRGVVSTVNDDKKRKTVTDIIDSPFRIYPVGRLDYDTTGIIILTNDGDFANYMTHPKNKIDKVYIAKINGILYPGYIKQLESGVVIDNKKTDKAKIRVKRYDKRTNTSIVEVIIHEGRNHQVKNMFKALGYDVLKLKREQIAFLTLGSLKSGEYRMITPKEVKQLYDLANNKNIKR